MADTRYTSDNLAHFVGLAHPLNHEANYGTLLKILRSGWVTHPPHDAGWGLTQFRRDLTQSLANERLIDPNVTCYADIPEDHLGIHLSKYGLFGLSFPRSLLVRYGARPVMYFPLSATDSASPYGRSALKDIEAVYRAFVKLVVDRTDGQLGPRLVGSEPEDQAQATLEVAKTLEREFLAFLKPFNADLAIETFDNFYLEREWRKYGNMEASSSTVSVVYIAEPFIERFKVDAREFVDRVRAFEPSRVDAKTRCGRCQAPLPADSTGVCRKCAATNKRHLEVVRDTALAFDHVEGWSPRIDPSRE